VDNTTNDTCTPAASAAVQVSAAAPAASEVYARHEQLQYWIEEATAEAAAARVTRHAREACQQLEEIIAGSILNPSEASTASVSSAWKHVGYAIEDNIEEMAEAPEAPEEQPAEPYQTIVADIVHSDFIVPAAAAFMVAKNSARAPEDLGRLMITCRDLADNVIMAAARAAYDLIYDTYSSDENDKDERRVLSYHREAAHLAESAASDVVEALEAALYDVNEAILASVRRRHRFVVNDLTNDILEFILDETEQGNLLKDERHLSRYWGHLSKANIEKWYRAKAARSTNSASS